MATSRGIRGLEENSAVQQQVSFLPRFVWTDTEPRGNVRLALTVGQLDVTRAGANHVST